MFNNLFFIVVLSLSFYISKPFYDEKMLNAWILVYLLLARKLILGNNSGKTNFVFWFIIICNSDFRYLWLKCRYYLQYKVAGLHHIRPCNQVLHRINIGLKYIFRQEDIGMVQMPYIFVLKRKNVLFPLEVINLYDIDNFLDHENT